MNFLKVLEGDGLPTPKLGRTRVVPSQPDGVAIGKVFVGSDLGEVNYVGEKPRAGELVVITGRGVRKTAGSGMATRPFRMPTFAPEECVCKCPAATGVAFYLTFVEATPVIHALDAATGTLQQLLGREELGYACTGTVNAAALAADLSSPHNLYVLDDRRNFQTIRTDTNPTIRRGYFGVATYTVAGGQYSFSRFDALTDPYSPGPTDPVQPVSEPDPPAIPGNCLGVAGGTVYLTMKTAPARYQSLSGGVWTPHTLTLNGTNYAKPLRGNVISVGDQPAKRTRRYVLATTDDVNFELLEFEATTDAISRVMALTLPARGVQLGTVCNRLLVLSATLDSPGSGGVD